MEIADRARPPAAPGRRVAGRIVDAAGVEICDVVPELVGALGCREERPGAVHHGRDGNQDDRRISSPTSVWDPVQEWPDHRLVGEKVDSLAHCYLDIPNNVWAAGRYTVVISSSVVFAHALRHAKEDFV
jgi:hypothetical protein